MFVAYLDRLSVLVKHGYHLLVVDALSLHGEEAQEVYELTFYVFFGVALPDPLRQLSLALLDIDVPVLVDGVVLGVVVVVEALLVESPSSC